MSSEDRETKAWADELRSRSEFVEDTQDALARSVEFTTLAHTHASMPPMMRKDALKQLADFAVMFVMRQEAQTGNSL